MTHRTASAIALIGALIAASCTDSSDDNSTATSTQSAETEEAASDTAEPATTEDTAVIPTDPTGDSTSATAVNEANVDDLRIVDLSDSLFEFAALGVAPVGNFYGPELLAGTFDNIDADSDVVETIVGGVNVAPEFALDLEGIAALEPDLIVTSDGFAPFFGDGLDEIEAGIAPVVVISTEGDWQQRTRAVAAAVGLDAEADGRIASIEEELDALRTELADAGLAGSVISAVRQGPSPGEVYAFVPPSQVSTVLDDLGLVQPDAQTDAGLAEAVFPPPVAQYRLSEELLLEHDGDTILFGEVAPGDLDAFTSGPLASALSGVQTGNVAGVSYFVWALPTAVGVEEILRDIREHVLGG
ncbi:MAG: ABC transporter substrate-binding protein [Actinomycetota bacterium]